MPGDRRPISTRELALSKRVAARLAGMGWTPNGISMGGMGIAVLGGVAFALTAHGDATPGWIATGFVTGAVCAQLRLLANMFDGMVAVEHDQTSPVGDLYNELPDRVSDAALLIGLGYAHGSWPTAGWLAAWLAVSTAYVRAQLVVSGAPQDYGGPMAKPQRMALLTVTALFVALAPPSWHPHLAAGSGFSALRFPAMGLPALCLVAIALGCTWTIVGRIARGARSLRGPA